MFSWVSVEPHPGQFDAQRYNAVQGGYDSDGTKLFIGRAPLKGGVHLGKVREARNLCYIPLFGEEHTLNSFEVLSIQPGVNVQWIRSSRGNVPPNAVEGGFNENMKKTYVGRAPHLNALICGEIVPDEEIMYISNEGKEEEKDEYEALVISGGAPQYPQQMNAPAGPPSYNVLYNDGGQNIPLPPINSQQNNIPGPNIPPPCSHEDIESNFTCCGILLGIVCFPVGLICCCCMKEKKCRRCGQEM